MKNKSAKNRYDVCFLTLDSKYVLSIFCLMLLPFDLLTFATGIASADTDQLVEYKLSQDHTADSNDSSDQIKHQLWRSNITPFQDEKDLKSTMALNELIQQVRAIEFTSQEQKPKPVIVPEIVPSTEPNEVSSTTKAPAEIKKDSLEPKRSYLPVSEQTLDILRHLSQNDETIDHPFELGEILFLNGDLREAAVFYQEALNRTDPNDSNLATERAWLIFQKGNCLRNDDTITAATLYGQLITEYPNSLWADLARIQSQIIAWYQKDEPQKLIDEIKQQKIGIK